MQRLRALLDLQGTSVLSAKPEESVIPMGVREIFVPTKPAEWGTTMSSEENPEERLRLRDWLENQKERAEERIEDDSVGEEETLRWEGERDLINAIQQYLKNGVLELE